MNTTDPFVAALLQLASIMAGCWVATEAVGNRLRARGHGLPKLAISCVLGPAFSALAYALGWFTALPSVTAAGVPVTGYRGLASAAFAGLVAALVTSGAHGLVKAAGKGGGTSPGPGAAAVLLLGVLMSTGCISPQVRFGQRLFAGCPDGVDDKASLRAGTFVCRGAVDPAPFRGNGRACGSCHMPGDRFGLSVDRIAKLQPSHPLFFAGLDEDPALLRSHGLIRVIAPGGIDEFRQTPKLTHLQAQCSGYGGNCASLGLLGDRVTDLCAFSRQAVANHLSRSVERIEGRDFVSPTDKECEALAAYMVSDLVARGGR